MPSFHSCCHVAVLRVQRGPLRFSILEWLVSAGLPSSCSATDIIPQASCSHGIGTSGGAHLNGAARCRAANVLC